MSRRLSVRIGHSSAGAVEAPETYETDGSFAVDFDNEDRAVRVHVAPDGDLASVASVADNNQHLESDGTLTVPVAVDATSPTEGELKIATGYGAEERTVAVTVHPEPDETPVEARPSPADASGAGSLDGVGTLTSGPGGLPVGLVALSGIALLVAVVAAVVVGGPAALFGAGILLVGICAAGWLLLSDE